MKSFYIVTNPDKEGAFETEQQIRDYLEGRDARCASGSMAGSGDGRYTDSSQVPQEVDCVITIGGDGTLIQAARDLAGRNIPFIGVNRGHLGYLTQVSSVEELREMLDALLSGRYHLEKRMMLQGLVVRDGRTVYENMALNEIVISRSGLLKPMHFRILVNGEFLNQYTADGMIIATPTGSTAYNLSAGGPIVAPSARMMVLTPICSHALNSRSIVLPAEDEITVEMLDEGHIVSFDGNLSGEIRQTDKIIIRQAGMDTTLVQLKKISFLQNLSSKMTGV